MNSFNSYFVSNIQNIYGDSGIEWLKNLSSIIETLSQQWNFQFIKPHSNLSFNFIGLVKLNDKDETAILKMAPPNGNLSAEFNWLSSVTHGAPRVFAFDEKNNAFLMEYLEPGVSLKKMVKAGQDDHATKIICQTIRGFKWRQDIKFKFKHISEFIKSLAILKGKYDRKLLSQAESWFIDLTADKSNDVLLHGDLHQDNVLSSSDGWKVIDPHGYIGDPAAEVGAMVRNMWDCYKTQHEIDKVVERRLHIMADELPFDAQRIKVWAFCITVLSAAWTIEDHPDAKETDLDMEVAEAINKVKI